MRKPIVVSIIFLFAISIFLRLWKLDSIPPGLYPDEAMNGVNALEAIESGDYKVFYPENNGREGLFINIQALSIIIFGNTPLALRIISAIFGSLTIPGVFLLTWFILKNNSKEIDKKAFKIALLSALFAGLSLWHLNFSRIGFRAIMMPFLITYSLLFLVLGLRYWERSKISIFSFIISGLLLGTGMHTYTPFRLIPLLFIGIFLILFFSKKNIKKKTLFWRFSLLIIASIIVFLPLGLYFIQNPENFSYRSNKIYFFQQDNPLKELGFTLLKTAGMFNVVGDCNSRHNLSCQPQLNYLAGDFFLIGIIAVFLKKTRNEFKDGYLWILILGFAFSLLPGILVSEATPHALRNIGAIPFVFIFTALGVEALWQVIKKSKMYVNDKVFFRAMFFLIILIALLLDPYRYFYIWPKTNPDFAQNYLAKSYLLKQYFIDANKIIIANASTGVKIQNIPVTAMSTKYILWQDFKSGNLTYVLPEEIETFNGKSPFVLLALEEDDAIFAKLADRFPGGELIESTNNFGNFKMFLNF